MAGPKTGEGVFSSGVEGIVDEMRQNFREEGLDQLKTLAMRLGEARHARFSLEELAHEFLRVSLLLRSQSGALELNLVGQVAHRMEDFLAEAKTFPPRLLDDVEKFIEIMGDILEERIAPDTEASDIVRRLPPKIGFNVGDLQVRNVEILLVMLHGAAAHFVERELQQCGYRTHRVASTIEALPTILRTKPDLVIISAVMPELSGIDLAIGLATMPGTRNIPTALLTSLPAEDDYLKLVPAKVPIIRKGQEFGDDLARALDQLFII
jgi:CheY-like chemotaxis protein